MAGGEVAAGLVVAERGRADAVGAQHERVRDSAFAKRRRQRVVEPGRGEDEAVDVPVEQRLGRTSFLGGVVAACRDDGELAAARAARSIASNISAMT